MCMCLGEGVICLYPLIADLVLLIYSFALLCFALLCFALLCFALLRFGLFFKACVGTDVQTPGWCIRPLA